MSVSGSKVLMGVSSNSLFWLGDTWLRYYAFNEIKMPEDSWKNVGEHNQKVWGDKECWSRFITCDLHSHPCPIHTLQSLTELWGHIPLTLVRGELPSWQSSLVIILCRNKSGRCCHCDVLPDFQREPAVAGTKCPCLTHKDIMNAFTFVDRRNKLEISRPTDIFGSGNVISAARVKYMD